MSSIGKVSLRGLQHEDFNYGFLAGSSITKAALDAGRNAVTISSTTNTVELAGDGELLVGQSVVFEDRTVEGIKATTVSLYGGKQFTINPDASASSPDEIPAPGDFLVGAADDSGNKGYVQRASDAQAADASVNGGWQVVEVASDNSTCVAIKI